MGTGTMVALLKQVGTTAWEREMLKMLVNTSFSSSAQLFKTRPGTLSGPEAQVLQQTAVEPAQWMLESAFVHS